MCKWEDNIGMDLKEIVFEGVDWILSLRIWSTNGLFWAP